ncbi:MAG: hypothetical protein V7K26_02965 [Nostoc sp.]|uniref:hypothetical protein n=1 Tax=Nostoc sp. TaxID=1180 RepID=UPI002FF342A0
MATVIATDITNIATACAKPGNVKAEVATACAKHGNVKAEVTTGKAEVATACAKHGNIKAEVATACAKHGNVKAEVTTDTTDVTTVAALGCIACTNHTSYIIVPSSLAGRGLGVGFLYLTQLRTAIVAFYSS